MNTVKESDFILRRFEKPWIEFSDWTILVPIGFALVVLLLVFLFRREKRLPRLLWSSLFVGVLAVAYLVLAVTLRPMFTWWVIVVPCVGLALFYVGMMYLKDCQTIHPAWATFLGLLRVGVYLLLTLVFLLPALQFYEATFKGSKVVLLFDVSDSMIKGIGETPEEDQDPRTVPSRQDKILDWLTAANPKGTPLEQMLAKSPVTIYRFGGVLDDKNVVHIKSLDDWKDKNWNREQWAKFLRPEAPELAKDFQAEEERLRDQENKIKEEQQSLKPGADEQKAKDLQLRRDRLRTAQEKLTEQTNSYRADFNLARDLRGGTNIGRALHQVVELESDAFVQAIILFSDGQSNLGTEDDVKTFQAKVQKAKTAVHLFTVGVGTFLPPISVRVDELQGPKVARPDDKFPVRVPVIGTGVAERPFRVLLDLERLGKGEEKKIFPPIEAKFRGGDIQEETVEFEIDIKEMYKEDYEREKTVLAAKNDWPRDKVEQEALSVLEGKYQLTARVPRLKGESFPDPEHLSKPFIFQVQRHKPRILLFAGGPSREYQFLRTLLFREVTADRMDLSVLLQTVQEGTDQDVSKEKLLTRFPETLERGAKEGSLADFDLIIALDPDWTALTYEQFKMLQTWVDAHAGGIIFVAGPVHTFHLARPGGLDISPLLTVFPVVLKDSRLHGLGLDHDPSRPYYLQFRSSAKQYDFFNLEELPDNPTSGWDKFFWGDGPKPEPGKEARPERGIHNYYPVEKLKPDSIVLADFIGGEKSRINDGRDPQPFIVLMRYGQGKTLYISSPETWRLRSYKESLHERFWIKLSRYMAASTALKTNLGYISLSSEYTTGAIPFEAQLKGENGLPLPRDSQVLVNVARPDNFDPRLDNVTPAKFHLQPKPTQGEWKGWFTGTFKVRTPGKYGFTIPVPGTSGSVSHEIFVRMPNLEMDNLRTDFPVLWYLASSARPIVNRLKKDAEKTKELEKIVQTPPEGVDSRELGRGAGRLFFRLKHADYVPACLTVEEPRKVGEKSEKVDTWDKGWKTGLELTIYEIALWVLDGVGGFVMAILLITKRQWPALAVFVAAFALVHGLIGLNAWLATADEPSQGIMNVILVFAYIVGAVGLGATLFLTGWNREWAILATLVGFALTMFVLFLCDRLRPPDVTWSTLPVDFSFILVAVVGLLSLEWLTRKLLKLA